MASSDAEVPDAGLEEARRLAEEEERGFRHPRGWSRYLVPTIAICWCLFQLSIASWWLLDAVFVRSIHLGFAMLIVFLNMPTVKRFRRWAFLSAQDRIPLSDVVLALVACFAALYIRVVPRS